MGIVIALVVVGVVVILGGGNTLKGLGSDMNRTGTTLEQSVNGRLPDGDRARVAEPTRYKSAAQPEVPQLPKAHTYELPPPASDEAAPQLIPAARD